jgi:hypothetical protein
MYLLLLYFTGRFTGSENWVSAAFKDKIPFWKFCLLASSSKLRLCRRCRHIYILHTDFTCPSARGKGNAVFTCLIYFRSIQISLYNMKAEPSSATTTRHVTCKFSTIGSRDVRLMLREGTTTTSRGTRTCSGGSQVGPAMDWYPHKSMWGPSC